MNWKLIFGGGLVYYIAQFVVGMSMGPILHESVLEPLYEMYPQFWRPELNQDPPDLAALMPRWISVGVVIAFVSAAVYSWIRPALSGPGWQQGLKFGGILFLVNSSAMAGWSGIFNLPDSIWLWWAAEGLLLHLVGGAVLGWFGEKFTPGDA